MRVAGDVRSAHDRRAICDALCPPHGVFFDELEQCVVLGGCGSRLGDIFECAPASPFAEFSGVVEVDEQFAAGLSPAGKVIEVKGFYARVAIEGVEQLAQAVIVLCTEDTHHVLAAFVADQAQAVGFGHRAVACKVGNGLGQDPGTYVAE